MYCAKRCSNGLPLDDCKFKIVKVCAGTLRDNCEFTRTEMEKLRKKREECLLKIKSATWRAYQMKEKSKAMAKHQSSLEARLEMCKNGK